MAIGRTECVREQDVLDAVTSGRWDDELRVHTESCGICRDLRTIFEAMSEERDATWQEVTMPPANVIWWRSQIRAHEEARRAAERPIAVAQGVAVACVIAAALTLVPLAWPAVRSVAASASDVAAWLTPRASAVSSAFTLVTGTALPILPFAVASVLLVPILLYYALTEE
jgi:hypothetical protein